VIRSILDHLSGKTARKRAAMEVMDAYFKARAAYDQAKRRGDTREQHTAHAKMREINVQRLEMGL
jgi:hypothetical protein